MSIDYKLLGQHIRIRRKASGRTQESLAEALMVSVGYISQIERGVTKVSLDTLSNISAALDCELSELVTGTSRRQREYLYGEFEALYSGLDERKKRLLLNIARCIETG